jgi:L-rhamnose mutarotase
MIRKAFKMCVHPECHAEYEKRHNPIWPELATVLRDHGVRHYSIFLDAVSSQLFAYAEIESEERWQQIAATDVCQRWWRSMCELMPSHPDGRPKSVDLREVFHLASGKTEGL